MSKDGPINIPSIKGRISEKLKKAQSRVEEDEKEMEFKEDPAEITLNTAEERGAVALACLILENLREHGGTRAPRKPLENVLKRTLSTFDRRENMNIEIEAYEILLWIGNTIEPEWRKQDTKRVEQINPESSKDDLIRWAILHEEELQIQYYSRGRGELTDRRVTPYTLEAETYLHGYCHLRQDERVFRISRISSIHPAGGWPSAEDEDSDQEEDDSQMDLL
jgi:predicted DNA-binding transcriptional regulator YafY